MDGITKEEKRVIKLLEKLADKWPSELWLFSASGQLCLMRKNEDGTRKTVRDGEMDQEAVIWSTTKIENDGGDW